MLLSTRHLPIIFAHVKNMRHPRDMASAGPPSTLVTPALGSRAVAFTDSPFCKLWSYIQPNSDKGL